MLNKKPVIYGLAVLESIMFGMSFLATKTALGYLSPVGILACRWMVAGALFFILAALKVVKVDYRKKPIRLVILIALFQPCIYSIFEIWGIDMTTASESAIILALVPIFVTLITVTALKERIQTKTIMAILLSFAGVIMTVALGDDLAVSGKMAGYFCLMISVIAGACYTVLSAKHSDKFTVMEITCAMTAAGAVFFNILSLYQGNGLMPYVKLLTTPPLLVSVLYLGLGCSFLCYIIYNLVLSKIPAPQATTLQINLITVTGVLSGVIFRNEPLGLYKILGLVLILIGVVIANWHGGNVDSEMALQED